MFDGFLTLQIGDNLVKDYAISLGIFFVSIFLLQIFKSIILLKIKAFSEKTKTSWDDIFCDVLQSLGWPFYFTIALYAATRFITLVETLDSTISGLTLIVLTIYVVLSIQKLLEFLLFQVLQKHQGEEVVDSTISNFLKNAMRATLWVGAAIIILQNLGFQVGAFIGSLGIAGIAIAFALQNVLGDVFAFFSLYFDKPFKKGDFIIVGNDMGTIEKIGIKSTRVKTLQGQQLIIPNTELTQTRVNNYKRMEERRISFPFGVLYETPTKKLKNIPNIVKEIIEKEKDARFDRAHFHKFGDFSLDFEVVYYVKNQDYALYMDLQQRINLGIMEAFEKEGIEFAYPTQVVYMKK